MLEDREPTRDDASEVQEPTAQSTAPGKASNLAVWSYVLYNFGNTPFSATVMVLYFPLWLTEQYGAGARPFQQRHGHSGLVGGADRTWPWGPRRPSPETATVPRVLHPGRGVPHGGAGLHR